MDELWQMIHRRPPYHHLHRLSWFSFDPLSALPFHLPLTFWSFPILLLSLRHVLLFSPRRFLRSSLFWFFIRATKRAREWEGGSLRRVISLREGRRSTCVDAHRFLSPRNFPATFRSPPFLPPAPGLVRLFLFLSATLSILALHDPHLSPPSFPAFISPLFFCSALFLSSLVQH